MVTAEPAVGIGPAGYLLRTPEGNVAFEGCGWYSDAALDALADAGGVRWASASHPHVYGALWRVCERFGAELVLHHADLAFAKALPVAWAYDDRAELAPGVTLRHTGGHTPGHAVLVWERGRAEGPGGTGNAGTVLFCGDALKYTVDAGGAATTVSTHLAFDADVPLTPAMVRRYQDVIAPVDAEVVGHAVGSRDRRRHARRPRPVRPAARRAAVHRPARVRRGRGAHGRARRRARVAGAARGGARGRGGGTRGRRPG
jgi:glyoxylase-like metal-dependent hydrolase (beta-lactamase superfamily II)